MSLPQGDWSRCPDSTGSTTVEMVTTHATPAVGQLTDDLAAARERRGARLALAHLRAAGLESELVRRTLAVSA
ncbi:MAG: hypothetical protein M3P96_12755 [Actinomycetota bacterium]|nr:hypothetical protein [Actinomycetota bacterium]